MSEILQILGIVFLVLIVYTAGYIKGEDDKEKDVKKELEEVDDLVFGCAMSAKEMIDEMVNEEKQFNKSKKNDRKRNKTK